MHYRYGCNTRSNNVTNLNYPQCAIPVFEMLLDEPHNTRLMTLLYRAAEWHSLAKLRLHTDTTLAYFRKVTEIFCRLMREFRDLSCPEFLTVETPKEAAARARGQARQQAHAQGSNVVRTSKADTAISTRRPRTLNLSTYKFHSIADYPDTVLLFGTTDNYTTQAVSSATLQKNCELKCLWQVELEHRVVKRLYGLTNKNQHIEQIAKHYRRESRLHQATQTSIGANITTNRSRRLDELAVELHHHIANDRRSPINLFEFVRTHTHDPAKKVSRPNIYMAIC